MPPLTNNLQGLSNQFSIETREGHCYTPIFHLEDSLTSKLDETTLFPNKLTKLSLNREDHIDKS